LGWAQLTAWAGTLVVVVKQLITKKRAAPTRIMWLMLGMSVIAGGTLLMTTSKTQLIWEGIPWLAFVQFPWRWLGIAVILIALVAPFGLTLVPRKYQQVLMVAWWLLLVATSAHYFQGERYLPEADYYRGEPEYIRGASSFTLVDYLPRDFANSWQPPVPMETKIWGEGVAQPEIVVDRMHEQLYRFDNQTAQTVEVMIANYPGWMAEVDGQAAPITTSERGNIQVELPAGQVQLGLQLRTTPWRWMANLITGLSLCIVIYLWIYRSRDEQK
jgi:hypothetical protein